MNAFSDWLKIQFFIVLTLILVVLAVWLPQTGDVRLQQAEEHYRNGEAATTIAARKEGFNSALNLFLKLEEEHQPLFGTGRLSFNIGNAYYQLGEYPLAIAYYRRAESLMPRSLPVKQNLAQVREKAGVSEISDNNLFDALLFKSFISLPEKLQLFFGLSMLSFLFISAWLWMKKRWLGKLAAAFLILTAAVLTNVALSYYFSPIEAILVHAVELRRDAGMEFAKVGDGPIRGGTAVEVVGYASNGKWFEVVAPNNDFGYVPSTSLKLIRIE